MHGLKQIHYQLGNGDPLTTIQFPKGQYRTSAADEKDNTEQGCCIEQDVPKHGGIFLPSRLTGDRR